MTTPTAPTRATPAAAPIAATVALGPAAPAAPPAPAPVAGPAATTPPAPAAAAPVAPAAPTAPTLDEFVWRHTPRLKLLPLVHNSQCQAFASIVAGGALPPVPCNVFLEDLVYLFYGKPAFVHSNLPGGATENTTYPVCFVFKPKRGRLNICRVYPCDSGALSGGMFSAHMHAHRDNYRLRAALEAAERTVSLFFQSNQDYYCARPANAPLPPDAPTEARDYHALLTATGPTAFDDRRACVEIQADHPVVLRGYLSHVILPNSLLAQPTVYETIVDRWDATPCGYSTINGGDPRFYYFFIRQRVQTMLEEMGVM